MPTGRVRFMMTSVHTLGIPTIIAKAWNNRTAENLNTANRAKIVNEKRMAALTASVVK